MKPWIGILFCASLSAAPPIPVIFDTDIGNDVDDVLALSMLHSFVSRGEIRLVAVTVTKDNPWAPKAAAAINEFYDRPQIPIGMVRNGVTKEEGTYLRALVAAARRGVPESYPDAVKVLRQALEREADGSVVIIQVGFSTNLAHLLAEPDGRDLALRKVSRLVVMAGHFTNPAFREYNVMTDVPAARQLFQDWPTEIIASGFEIGERIKFPASSIEGDFAWAPRNPMTVGYKAYMKMPYDRETWDLTAVLHAVRPDAGYFRLSGKGRIRVEPAGETRFEPDAAGPHQYLILDAGQIARIREALILLATEPARGLLN